MEGDVYMREENEFEGSSEQEIALACVLKALLPAGTASHKTVLQECGQSADVEQALKVLLQTGMIESSGRFHVRYELRDEIVQQFRAAHERQEELRSSVAQLRENEKRLRTLRSDAYKGSPTGVIDSVYDAVQVYSERSGMQLDTEKLRQQLHNVLLG